MKKYGIFIDDERSPKTSKIKWKIARNLDEVKALIINYGFPSVISFDHDLGYNTPTGMDIAKWIVDYDLDNHKMPDDFAFNVHSANPPGTKNITKFMENYLKFRKKCGK